LTLFLIYDHHSDIPKKSLFRCFDNKKIVSDAKLKQMRLCEIVDEAQSWIWIKFHVVVVPQK
jgi:hypothetical protein